MQYNVREQLQCRMCRACPTLPNISDLLHLTQQVSIKIGTPLPKYDSPNMLC